MHSRYTNGRTFGRRPSFRGTGRAPIRRNFSVARIDVSKFINKNSVPEPLVPFIPTHSFADFPIDARLKKNIELKGYKVPSPIQDRAIPIALQGSDVVGIANTGTGKTAAFLIPLINMTLIDPKKCVLIVVPTRELAQQIDAELRSFCRNLAVFSVTCVGGASIGNQMRALRHHNQFIIGTPGRLKDLLERKLIDLSHFNAAVLDEADRMLDMGFIADMRSMLSLMPKEKQTLFFSATISPDIERLIKDFLREPVRISVKTGVTAKNIEQDVVRVGTGQTKLEVLKGLLSTEGFKRVLIFGRTKHGVQRLSNDLVAHGFKSTAIHGNKSQPQRMRALHDFKEDRAKILVATDVAARGLDISDITHVINYDLPATEEDYVHRIGRTGRGDNKGKALTFVE